MNLFLACFLACAFVQVLVLVFTVQFLAWKNRREAAQALRAIPTPAPEHVGMMRDHSAALMRLNTEMHSESFRVLANMTEDLRDENTKLRIENETLRKQLDDKAKI